MMKLPQFAIYSLVLLFSLSVAPLATASDAAKATKELIEDAEIVFRQSTVDGIAAAKQVDKVFLAANRLAKDGRQEDAAEFFLKGLRLSPWDLEEQLNYAEVLLHLGRQNDAKDAARIAYQRAEDGKTIERARKLAGLDAKLSLEVTYTTPLDAAAIVLVPMGEVEGWLLDACGEALTEILGVHVYQWREKLEMPSPGRSNLHHWINQTRAQVNWDHPVVKKLAEEMSVENVQDLGDEPMLKLLRQVVSRFEGQDQLQRFDTTIAEVRESGGQWEADELLVILESAVHVPNERAVVYLGVTEHDLYGGSANYVYGMALDDAKLGITSACRFRALFNGEPPDRRKLVERLTKQMLSSVGFAIGVRRPTDPTSARAYSSNLAEMDAREMRLSRACVEGFERALGRPLPEKTRERALGQ